MNAIYIDVNCANRSPATTVWQCAKITLRLVGVRQVVDRLLVGVRGWLDQLLSRSVDVLMAIPSLIFALVLLSIFGATVTNLIMISAVLDSTRVFRLTRAVALNVVVMDYVEAARLRGEGLGWIMRREIIPNIMPPLIAEFGLRFCFVFLSIAALSFLGVGIQPPTDDWWVDGPRQCVPDPIRPICS